MRRVERLVGLFVVLAFLILATGFISYAYHTANRKGWFLPKARCHTFLQHAEGIRIGDPVRMLGFDVGEITQIKPMPAFSELGKVYVEFEIKGDNIGYIWDDSKVRVTTADLLGKRAFELIPGGTSGHTNLHASFSLDKAGSVTGVWNKSSWDPAEIKGEYKPYGTDSHGYTLYAEESPTLSTRLDQLASKVEAALPGLLNLTNQIRTVLTRLDGTGAAAERTLAETRPLLSNLTAVASRLNEPDDALGRWLINPKLQAQLQNTLLSAQGTLTNSNTRIDELTENVGRTLDNLASITSNLNAQVQANTNLVSAVTKSIQDADDLVQGLKRHWLLKSAFQTNPPTTKRPHDPAKKPGHRP